MNANDQIAAIETPGDNALHLWWELSYAEYLTIPRSAMQSMPDKWQVKMAELLTELDHRIDWRPKQGCYKVELRDFGYEFDEEDEREKFVWKEAILDPLAPYDRGRRRLSLKLPDAPAKLDANGKAPYLFYYEDGVNSWCPVPELTENFVSVDHLADDDKMTIEFWRKDMTPEEFSKIPEV